MEVSAEVFYRKINNLIEKGILVEDGFIRSEQGRIIHKYRNLFEEISISISNETFSIKGHIGKKFIEKSSIFQFLDIWYELLGREILLL